jgi:hypothetical protein
VKKNIIETRNYEFTRNGGEDIVVQEHSLDHTKTKATSNHGADPHFNISPYFQHLFFWNRLECSIKIRNFIISKLFSIS